MAKFSLFATIFLLCQQKKTNSLAQSTIKAIFSRENSSLLCFIMLFVYRYAFIAKFKFSVQIHRHKDVRPLLNTNQQGRTVLQVPNKVKSGTSAYRLNYHPQLIGVNPIRKYTLI
jgi:hypothetical protein